MLELDSVGGPAPRKTSRRAESQELIVFLLPIIVADYCPGALHLELEGS